MNKNKCSNHNVAYNNKATTSSNCSHDHATKFLFYNNNRPGPRTWISSDKQTTIIVINCILQILKENMRTRGKMPLLTASRSM